MVIANTDQPVDREKYDENFDIIFKKGKTVDKQD